MITNAINLVQSLVPCHMEYVVECFEQKKIKVNGEVLLGNATDPIEIKLNDVVTIRNSNHLFTPNNLYLLVCSQES